MRLRAIELTNVRRFAGQVARIGEIGDGITVLAQPNEFGKSTFFDALHALFFEAHGGRAKTVTALQPHAGGAPEVVVELDSAGRRFRVSKRWLSRPRAVVEDATGAVVAQGDEAEAWIARLVSGGLGGPAGLLWVRQGLTGLEPEAKREQEAQLATRRDLLSSVAGEIDMMTGGRRMDAVMQRLEAELQTLATATGRPKAGGPWDTALKEAEDLGEREAELSERLRSLSGALAGRADAQRRLAALTDPEAERMRRRALADAEAADARARAHADELARANQAQKLAEATLDGLRRDAAMLRERALRATETRDAQAVAETALGKAAERRRLAEAEDAAAAAAMTAAEADAEAREAALAAARRAQKAAEARARAATVERQLEQAEAHRRRGEEAESRAAAIAITPAAVEAAEAAEAALEKLLLRRSAQAVRVRFDYDGEARAAIDDVPLTEEIELHAAAEIALPGLGRLRIDPGGRGGALDGEIAAARARLREALADCAGATTLPEARQRLATRQALGDEAAQAATLLAAVAPDGLAALATLHARLTAEAASEDDGDAGDPEDVEHSLLAARTALATARGAREAAGKALTDARIAWAAANERRQAAAEAARAAAEALGAPEEHRARLADLAARIETAEIERDTARARTDALRAAAPDLETVAAALGRARAVAEQAAKDTATLNETLAELAGTIRTLADEGIEEELGEIRGRRATAEDRAARFAAEAAALARLRRALDEARRAARETYFGPVMEELQPLLAMLHGEARVEIDDRTLLPAALDRGGVIESLDILSGGTREQIAILTRLAFARLFTRQGRSVPIILDDALVHTDDDRIEAMFVALHRVARDQQILVLTCRQRAFAALGGATAAVTIRTAD